jgi:hypothetical protein
MASAAYERRIANYIAKHPGATRSDARGHRATPEKPHLARGNPEKYGDYIERRRILEAQVNALKGGLFSEGDKWRADRSARNVATNPDTHKPPRMSYMQRFINSGEDLFGEDDFDWGDPDWGFLKYH